MAVVSLLTQTRPAYVGAPIHYEAPATKGPVERLQAKLRVGEFDLAYDAQKGWLPALLTALDIPVSSQGLVFSKTSLQVARISPKTPRAIYFGDDVYVAWIPGAPWIEVSSMDPERGPVFYALLQRREGGPRFERRDTQCLTCHASPRTNGWPGTLIRSVHTKADGHPRYASGSFLTTYQSPLRQRWGGWYVTGTHGRERHMGNSVLAPHATEIDLDAGANVSDLSQRFDTSRYPTAHSDIVALMVLEHQTQMHSQIARASFEARRLLDCCRTPEERSERLARIAKPLVEHLMFQGEARLHDRICGTSGFAAEFSARARRDPHGRSLRDFDLRRRLFRYPCSYVIYSPAFDALPRPLLDVVYAQLLRVLRGGAREEGYKYLSRPRRKAILEILLATKRGLPAAWRD